MIVGGGAAGFFAAIASANAAPSREVIVLERGPEALAKVRISGGGRCNVTHACFDPRRLVESYPRGRRELLGAFHRFQPRDTVQWFEDRGVALKTESDGRIFPVSDSSDTIVRCLLDEARHAGVILRLRTSVDDVKQCEDGTYRVVVGDGSTIACDRLLIAAGGCRSAAVLRLIEAAGHTLEPPVPSLFAFDVATTWVGDLAGVALEDVEATAGTHRERGALLFTHQGLSGPAILRLSAAGARDFHRARYHFDLRIRWLPEWSEEQIRAELAARRESMPKRLVVNATIAPIPARLWERLVAASGIDSTLRWHDLSRAAERRLARTLTATTLPVSGKSLNKEEFVTCGGVRLGEVDWRTMESRRRPGLHFAGEVLDVDGFTGGFNFQSAWTTGWIAGMAMADTPAPAVSGTSRTRTR